MDEAPLDVAGRVAAAAAHAFNNHVAAIALQAELALASLEPGDDKLRSRLEGVLGSCGAARDLSRDLLAFGGRRPLHPERVDLRELVGGGPEPCVVEVDRTAFAAALEVLREAAPDPELAAAGEWVELRFRGDLDERALEPFAGAGRSVGLGVVYGLVRQSGGDAVQGSGELTLRLPRVR